MNQLFANYVSAECDFSHIREHAFIQDVVPDDSSVLLRCPPRELISEEGLRLFLNRQPLEVLQRGLDQYQCIGNLHLYRWLAQSPGYAGPVPIRIYPYRRHKLIQDHILLDVVLLPLFPRISSQACRTLWRAWQLHGDNPLLANVISRRDLSALAALLGEGEHRFKP